MPAELDREDLLTERPPKQARSRKSQIKVLKAARELLEEEGYEGLTLQKVSQRSGVSIGSIYGRFTGKDELMRAVHALLLQELAEVHGDLLDVTRWQGVSLTELIPQLFDGFADILRSYAPALRPMMLRATQDAQISARGTESYREFVSKAMAVLLPHSSEVDQPDPAEALRFALFAAFSVYRNHLGFGSDKGEMPDADWATIKANTNRMVLSYLRPTG